MKVLLRAVLALALLLVAGSASLWAQESRATIGGRVMDPQGAVIPGASVVVVSEDTGVKQETTTNERGAWSVRFLIPGPYSVTVSATGFKSVERKGIILQTSDNKVFDTELQLGSTVQTLDVSAEATLIDTTSASSGTVITERSITEMPSMSRVTTLLVTLSPGAMQQDQNNNTAHLWSHDAASQFTVNGGRNNVRSNDFQLDGMPNLKTGGQAAFIPPPDAVQEFRVQMNAYDAAIGRQAGSTIQMTLKSGTNQYHGSLYEFNQNNVLNANQFQTNRIGGTKPPIHYNEYGGTFGGPVYIPKVYNGKEKTFFFVNYNGIRNKDPRNSTRSLPTELERSGDFSESYTTQLVNGARIRYPIQVFDPLTVDAKGVRQLFPNMTIPKSRLSPVAQAILGYVPLPNTASDGTSNTNNNFVSDATRENKMAIFTARGDHNWNNNHKSFATVRWYHEDELSSVDFHNAFTGGEQHRMTKGTGLDHVWTIDATKVLDIRFNITRYEEPNNDHGVGFDPTVLGLSNRLVSQMAVPVAPRITGVFGDIGVGQAGNVVDTSYYTWSGVMTQVKGNMTWKYGSEYWILQQANKDIGNQGQFGFGSEWTRQQATAGGGVGNGSNFASYLLGLPNGGSFNRNADGFYSQRFFALYAQNDWRVNNRLTLNMGLRWDYETPVTERFNRMTSYYDRDVINPVSAAAQQVYANILAGNPNNAGVQALQTLLPASAFQVKGAIKFAGVDGRQRSTFNGDFREFQPRLGFAYKLLPNTVIRGGVGRFVQASYETGWRNGFSRTTNLIATPDNYMTAYDTLDNPFRDGILSPTGSSLGALTNLGQGVNMYNQNPGRMHSWEYSLHLQHEYKGWLFEAGYTHNKTYGIYQDYNINLPSYALWQQLRAPRFDANGRPTDRLMWDELVPNPFYKLPGVTGTLASNQNISLNQLIRPITILGDIQESDNNWGKNQYDALVAKVEHRFSKGFMVINSFTWSKLFEDTSLWGPQISGPITEHKLGGEDRPLHLSIAPVWELPFGRNRAFGRNMNKVLDAIVGGWQLSGQFNIQSGVPVVFGTDSFFSGQNFALSGDEQSLGRWFDTSQFLRFPDKNTTQATLATYPAWTGIQNMPGYNYTPAANDTIKNGVYQDFATYVRRYPTRWGIVRASRVNNLDLMIAKNFSIREKIKFQYRFEAFNAFNHARFAAPNSDPTSSSFGVVTPSQQNPARAVQMALKLSF